MESISIFNNDFGTNKTQDNFFAKRFQGKLIMLFDRATMMPMPNRPDIYNKELPEADWIVNLINAGKPPVQVDIKGHPHVLILDIANGYCPSDTSDVAKLEKHGLYNITKGKYNN